MKYVTRYSDHLSDLQPAELAHLVLGATLYFRDPRKTPVKVVEHDPQTASFTVQVGDFEDKGAEWILPLWDISKFTAPPNSRKLTRREQDVLGSNVNSLNRQMQIGCSEVHFEWSQSEISAIQKEIYKWLCSNFVNLPHDAEMLLNRNVTCDIWAAAMEQMMDSKGLLQIDRAFAAQFASNPNASEVIKGHRIVLAELGLCPYQGSILRDPKTFEGDWSKPKRRTHILTRLAFMRAMLSIFRLPTIPLFRAIYSEDTLSSASNKGFVSTTFSNDVALSLFEAGQKTRVAAMYWQEVPVERLFISYLETPILSSRYQEAEAVLLFDPSASVF